MHDVRPVAIVTDSATAIPESLIEKYRISIVPYWVQMGDRSLVDGVDLTPGEFFQRVRADASLAVSTSVPSPEVFLAAYQKAAAWAQGIVSIHLAGEQSATCQVARLAATSSPVPVRVVDTQTTAMAEGFIVLEAAKAAAAGATFDEVVALAESLAPHVEVLALLENVGYAIRGGRLASAARMVGSFLRIQPIVRVAENKVSIVGQVRRRAKGLELLFERVTGRSGENPTHLAVHFADDEQEGRSFLDRLQARLNCVETFLVQVPVALGVHAGPGSIGVAYYVEGGMLSPESGALRSLSRLQEQAKGLLENVNLGIGAKKNED